jgi:hypothetical protein
MTKLPVHEYLIWIKLSFFIFSYWYVAQSCGLIHHCLNNLYLPTSIRITRWICYPSYRMYFFDKVKVSFFSTNSTLGSCTAFFDNSRSLSSLFNSLYSVQKILKPASIFTRRSFPHLLLQSSPIPSSYTKVLVIFWWTIKARKKKEDPKLCFNWTNFLSYFTKKWAFFCIQSHDAIFKLQERHIQMHTLKKKLTFS